MGSRAAGFAAGFMVLAVAFVVTGPGAARSKHVENHNTSTICGAGIAGDGQ